MNTHTHTQPNRCACWRRPPYTPPHSVALGKGGLCPRVETWNWLPGQLCSCLFAGPPGQPSPHHQDLPAGNDHLTCMTTFSPSLHARQTIPGGEGGQDVPGMADGMGSKELQARKPIPYSFPSHLPPVQTAERQRVHAPHTASVDPAPPLWRELGQAWRGLFLRQRRSRVLERRRRPRGCCTWQSGLGPEDT